MAEPRLCLFGEVLFDHFPDGSRVLGGAPFNVAWHLQAFGQMPYFISRVGNDPDGEAVRRAMETWGMDECGLQTDDRLPTGSVGVRFTDGEPSYDIVHPSAYDAIDAAREVPPCRLLYHGSLALRDAASRGALAAIMATGPELVFVDVNLRSPWWSVGAVLSLLRDADWVKLNRDELALLHPDADARAFIAIHDLQGLILTHGGEGAEVFTVDGAYHQASPDGSVQVVDTVGAGDAFASVMILGIAHGWSLSQTLRRAQDFASRMVGQRGATVSDMAFYSPLRRDWNL
ncbi:MAG: carbohydrate kinase [Gammaproteobacteria bacterium]|nr:carbohydrate kinase [Gammaproteobacteria bacterium]MCP5137206.1 carbohydrate kinase [Gammaproteobacteria bacterium]